MKHNGPESGFVPDTKQEAKKELPVFEYLKNPELRKELKKRTENLVDRVDEEGVDVVFFLDKSARPISWLFQDLWKQKFPEKRLPAIRYINVGSGHAVREKELSGTSKIDLKDLVHEAKKIFGKQFHNKSMLVVDEIAVSGITELTARQFLQNTFPEATKVDSMHLFHLKKDKELFTETFGRLPWGDYFGTGVGVFDLDDEILVRSISPESAKRKADEIMENILKEMEEYDDERKNMWEMVLFYTKDIKKHIQKIQELDLNSFLPDDQIESIHQLMNRLEFCLEKMQQTSSESKKDQVFCFMEMGQIASEAVLFINKDILKKELFELFAPFGVSKFIGSPITNPWNRDKFYYFYNLSQSRDKCKALREMSLQLRKEMKAVATEKSE